MYPAITRIRDAYPDHAWLWCVVNACERVVSALILLALAPLWIALAIAIAAISRQSPLVALLRAGRFGEPLWMLKFRTMWSMPPGPFTLVEYIVDESGPVSKAQFDSRILSPFAHFCRRFSLDEIPQLLHVVTGRMSFAAPRPVTYFELTEHYGPAAEEVLSVRPGITGLWQVSGRNLLPYPERRKLDLNLVRNLSLPLYCQILARTVAVVLTGKNSW